MSLDLRLLALLLSAQQQLQGVVAVVPAAAVDTIITQRVLLRRPSLESSGGWSGLHLSGVTDHGAIGGFAPALPPTGKPGNGFQLGELQRFRAAFDAARYGPGWDQLDEQKRGVLDFAQWSNMDRWVKLQVAVGSRPLIILCYGNPLYDQDTPECRHGWPFCPPHTATGISAFVNFSLAVDHGHSNQGFLKSDDSDAPAPVAKTIGWFSGRPSWGAEFLLTDHSDIADRIIACCAGMWVDANGTMRRAPGFPDTLPAYVRLSSDHLLVPHHQVASD